MARTASSSSILVKPDPNLETVDLCSSSRPSVDSKDLSLDEEISGTSFKEEEDP